MILRKKSNAFRKCESSQDFPTLVADFLSDLLPGDEENMFHCFI